MGACWGCGSVQGAVPDIIVVAAASAETDSRPITIGIRREIEMSTKHRILIADDNQANCELLEAYLVGLDCVIDVAEDGQETMDQVQAVRPDLILLDVMMPKLSGFEICKQLKSSPETKSIMILMVTALNELGDIQRAVEVGADDFISKPVNRVELLKRVENMLALKHISDENERLRQYIERMETRPGVESQ